MNILRNVAESKDEKIEIYSFAMKSILLFVFECLCWTVGLMGCIAVLLFRVWRYAESVQRNNPLVSPALSPLSFQLETT